jgi:hypothetical protein
MCVYNTESVHVIVQGFSYRYESSVASIRSFSFAYKHTHVYFIRVLVPFSQETCNSGLHFSSY